MANFKDLTGQKFGRLTVLKTFRFDKYTKCVCKCQCGNEKTINATDLVRGRTKSCGCLQKEVTSKTFTRHGQRHTRLYKIWEDMKKRCYNTNCKVFNHYGGRGITVCQEWLDDFMNFYNWAIANGYNDSLTIDRINFNGNYESSNCRWVDMKTQARNTRHCHYVEYKGIKKPISEWCEELNIKRNDLYKYTKKGLSYEQAFRKLTGE